MLLDYFPFFLGIAVVIMLANTLRSKTNNSHGKYTGLVVIIIAMGIILIFSSYNGVLNRPLKFVGFYKDRPFDDTFYGIMFDAGSTGSRIHVFKFEHVEEGKPFKFIEEHFEFNSKGLSSFADNPVDGAESLRTMMDSAKLYIPVEQWKHTPIALKATAGLRLLPKDKADSLLDEVRKFFGKYPFKASSDSVSIMGGTEEGIFSWFTVNFLNGVLGDVAKMYGVIDLGGGSTQITFAPEDEDTIKNSPPDYLLDENLFGQDIKLYSHSYLGYGLMAGRLASLGEKDLEHGSEDDGKSKKISSVCMAKGLEGTMHYGSKDYQVVGVDTSGKSRFTECYALTNQTVSNVHIPKIEEIKRRQFYTISYFYDRASDCGLIDEMQGGEVQVEDFYKAAEKECQSSDGSSTKKPFLCLDLCYISALLHEGFGFKKDSSVILKKKIGTTEISWALGAMFDFYNKEKAARAA